VKISQGGGGDRFHPKSYLFGDSNSLAQFQNPVITPSGRKVSEAEERREKHEVAS
jgi:hypothetical protein